MINLQRKELAVLEALGAGTEPCDNRHQMTRLLRELVSCANEGKTSQFLDGGHEEVLEIELDGHTYVLVRYPVRPQDSVLLSPREQEIVRLVAKGLPNKAIATLLDISPWTVATYVRRVFQKMDVNSRAEMIARVARDRIALD